MRSSISAATSSGAGLLWLFAICCLPAICSAQDPATINERFSNDSFDHPWDEKGGKVVTFESAPALLYEVPIGVNEVTPAKVQLNGRQLRKLSGSSAGVEHFEVEWKEYFTKDYEFPRSGQKLMRFADETGEGGPSINIEVKDTNSTIQIMSFHAAMDELDKAREIFKNVEHDFGSGGRGGVATGQWVTYKVHGKLNTPGKSDGLLALSIDGEEVYKSEDLDLRGDDSRGYTTFWIGGNYSNGQAGNTTRVSKRYIRDITLKVFGAK